MKILFRYRGNVFLEREITPGEYKIGRSDDNDFVLLHEFISRRHGIIYYQNDGWYYRDLRHNHPNYMPDPQILDDSNPVEVENGLWLLTRNYAQEEITQITIKPPPVDTLMSKVRPKVVELTLVMTEKAIEDYRQYADLGDSDFREFAGFASGFIIAPDVVLTANHCLQQGKFIDINPHFKIKTHDGRLFEPKRVLGFNVQRDFLFIEVPGLKEYGYLDFGEEKQVGEKVYTVGNVLGEGIAIRDGILASKTQDPNFPEIEYLRFSAATSPGNSGGPLLDCYGKVIGIVFAGTWTENYNVATSSKYLVEGKTNFVDNREKKSLPIETKRLLNYTPDTVMYFLNYPSPYIWGEKPEYYLPFKYLSVEVEVPKEILDYAKEVIRLFDSKILSLYEDAKGKMKNDGDDEGSWESGLSERVPLIRPSPHIAYQNETFETTPQDLIVPSSMGAVLPATSRGINLAVTDIGKEGSFFYPSYRKAGNPSRVQTCETEGKETGSTYKYSFDDYKRELHNFTYDPEPIVTINVGQCANWETVRKLSKENVLKNISGKEGLLFSTMQTPYVRPGSYRYFTIPLLDEPLSETQIRDERGRRWDLFTFPLFGAMTIDSYCLPLPQGVIQMVSALSSSQDFIVEYLRRNLIKYKISTFLTESVFWQTEALLDFFERGYSDSLWDMKDIMLGETDSKSLIIGLKTLGIEFILPHDERPKMLRFHAGLSRKHGASWIGLGFDAYYQGKNGKSLMRGAGVEQTDNKTSYCLYKARNLGPLKSKTHKKAGIWQKTIKTQRSSDDLTLYSYSTPMKQEKKDSLLVSQDFEKLAPYKIDYRILD